MPNEEKPPETTNTAEERVDLESQFILRLPSVPAASLKAAVGSGVMNLKDRLSIQLDSDMKHGTVRFDGWVLPAKIVDLPCVIESHKTLDRKNFYKTADVSQMMICKEGSDWPEAKEKEEEEGKKTKDGKDKKYLWSHGITPPLKNVRKRRFRKTLKKKYVDFPEIEKEVKRLLRMDNEACNVRYEVVNADDELKNDGKMSANSTMANSTLGLDVGEHDIFGDVVSSSDDDDTRANYSDDESRLSITNKDSLMREGEKSTELMTEFPKGVFAEEQELLKASTSAYDALESSKAAAAVASLEEDNQASSALTQGEEQERIYMQIQEIENDIQQIHLQIRNKEDELREIDNPALKQRFQSIIEDLKKQEHAKKQELNELNYMYNT